MALSLHSPTVLLLKASDTAEITKKRHGSPFYFQIVVPAKKKKSSLFFCSVGESSALARFQSGRRKSAVGAPCASRNSTRPEAGEALLEIKAASSRDVSALCWGSVTNDGLLGAPCLHGTLLLQILCARRRQTLSEKKDGV